MRIALAGSHGTGKTTLLSETASALGLPALHELAREEIKKRGKLPHQMTPDELADFQATLLYDQVHAERTHKSGFISDRSLLDVLAYSQGTKYYDILKLKAKYVLEERPYDKVFYLPVEFPMQSDGVRKEDEEFRMEIDRRIKELLTEFKIDFSTVTGNIEERVAKIIHHTNGRDGTLG